MSLNVAAATTNASVPLIPDTLPADDLKKSITGVVESLTGKTVTSETLQGLHLTEDILYASVVHQRLEAKFPGIGASLLGKIESAYSKNVTGNKRQPLSTAVDNFLNSLVTKKQMTNSAKETLIRYSFGKAQLDNAKTTLARATENATVTQAKNGNTLDSILARVDTNRAVGQKALDKFEERLGNNKTLTKEQARAQADVLDRLFPKPAEVSAPQPPPNNPITPPPGPSETDKPGDIPDERKIVTGPDEFAYKPESELDNKMVVIIPKDYRNRAISASIIALDGETVILEMKNPRYGDDNRPYFRSDRSGKEFAGAAVFRVTLVDGSVADFSIPDLKPLTSTKY